MTDQGSVSWGRYDAEHRALVERVDELDRAAEALRGFEARIAGLEHAAEAHRAADHTRRDRLWLLVLGLTTGIVAPLLVTTLITFLHIRATR